MKRIRKRKKLKMMTKIYIVIFLIISFTYFFVHQYFAKINPKIIEVANQKIEKVYKYFLSTNVGYDLLKDLSLNDILEINKNKDGEILNVDFNLKKSYQTLEIITNKLTENINDLESGNVKVNDKNIISRENSLVLELPMFMASDYALLSNLGPKIYFQANFIGTLLTNVKTKITNYGMNNALVEIYSTLELTYEVISPVTKDIRKLDYEVLLASSIINGRVPEFYGGEIAKETQIVKK